MSDLVRRLERAVPGGVDASSRRLAEYSSDASNYRVPPRVVVFPRHVDEILAVAEVARESGVPLTARGGGTSVAGNAVGPGIVVDFSRHLDRVLELDPAAATALVQPGVVLASLQAAGAPHGLRFGPDPSTQARCTIGGMIGNNACGPHAVAYGSTAANVVELDWLDGAGRRFAAGRGLDPVEGLADLVGSQLAVLRTELGRFARQVSGYSLEHLLPERGHDLAKALVGTEGTCGLLLGARVRLFPVTPARALVVLGYPDMPAAADAVPALLAHRPLAVEGLDARLVDAVRRQHGSARVPPLPSGAAWLLVEAGGDDDAAALAAAAALVADADPSDSTVLTAGPEAAALWRIREDSAGLAGRTATGAQAWPGWEDAAVPPERLGAYLRDFDALLAEHGLDGLLYGHFGDGCVHVRLDLPLVDAPRRLRPFLTDAARLVAAHGGSLSGEHGDGRARGELLPLMYSPAAIGLFERFKGLLDPPGLLNPGVVVRPAPVDADLRRPAARPLPAAGGFAFAADGGDLTTAVHRCVGVGKCRADLSSSGEFMCPSYLATRDEKDSTRGRARVLQELAAGSLPGGFGAAEVRESLDLCLSCKACRSDCPTGIDIATYKAGVLYRSYRRRLRPRSHYLLGRLPAWARLAGRAPRLVNAVLSVRPLRRALLRLGGLDPRRDLPRFASPFHRQHRRRAAPATAGRRGPVLVWVDSFTNAFAPDVAHAVIRVLTDAGYAVTVSAGDICCALTWISTGQLDQAKARLRRLLAAFEPYARAGTPIVGVEPSCTAVLRSDLVELLGDDPRSHAVEAATHTLAELLDDAAGWTPPDLTGATVVAQPHCHQHATAGNDADLRVLRRSGAEVTTITGCCGLAGNFGMEAGHYDVSVAVAENGLVPALRADPDAVLLADGFSCRTQAEQLAGRRGVHLAELFGQRRLRTAPRRR
ncbi:FAD-binding and (Fe-S)-binding domain-containing protein [Jiangella alkaliphila]|uniref:FAD/FMN-containing dehydrogenase n=1 Tax=Jiangella alkaliphila TaxID=419479 RepID=A0A1H2JTC4_9ACTN|nr:FAD-binding and (Fe-S)-binding domain-containing protein [Jiangella alkaliphila]SDU59285.1 FAD/FMN-containing dehydrogenase [Jiangella alkaliphila]